MGQLLTVSPLGLATRWSTRSQDQARRNAMAAHTALTARRHERLEVQRFVAEHLAEFQDLTGTTPAAEVRQVG